MKSHLPITSFALFALFAIIAGCSAGDESSEDGEGALTTGPALASEGQPCGGDAGIECRSGLVCQLPEEEDTSGILWASETDGGTKANPTNQTDDPYASNGSDGGTGMPDTPDGGGLKAKAPSSTCVRQNDGGPGKADSGPPPSKVGLPILR